MPWTPDRETIYASVAAPAIPYDGGGPWDRSRCASSPSPRILQLAAILRGLFPSVRSIGMLNCTPLVNSRTGVASMSAHAVGRGLDAMVRDRETGKAIASWCVQNASWYGIQLVIWDRVVWQGNSPRARRFTVYTGPHPHTDHVHVEVNTAQGYPGAPGIGLSTFPATGLEWVRTRFAMLVEVLGSRGFPPELSLPIAWAMLCQLVLEVGPFHARGEWDYNVGNLVCRGIIAPLEDHGWHGACHVFVASDNAFRSYSSLRDGVTDYVRLMMSPTGSFSDAFRYLVQHPDDPAGWYQRVLGAGYVGHQAPAALAGLLAMYRSVLRDTARRLKG